MQQGVSSLDVSVDLIILRSATLEERLVRPADYYCLDDNCDVAKQRYADLVRSLDIDADGQLDNYLQWSGYGSLRDLPLGEPRPGARPMVRSAWSRWLLDILEAHRDFSSATVARLDQCQVDDALLERLDPETGGLFLRIDRSRPQAAVQLHALSVALATRRLRERCGVAMEILEPLALQGLQEHLWRLLNRLVEPVLQRAWRLHCLSEGVPITAICMEKSPNESGAERTFLDWLLLADGYQQLLLSHASLARLVASAVQAWVDDCTEFIVRLGSDRHLIQDALLDGHSLDTVSQIEDGLSDPHCGGRSVKKLWLKNGRGLIYKPRDCGTLTSLQHLLAYVREHSDCSLRAVPPCLSREGYGWVAFVNRSDCASEAEIRIYYERAGELLALLYLLRTNDAHYENVIATAREPLLIDADTVLYPGFYNLAAIRSEVSAADVGLQYCELAIEESVVSSGLLPMWDEIQGLRDAGGFSDFYEASLNYPRRDHQSIPIRAYIREVCRGYRRLSLFFLGPHRQQLLGLLEVFESCITRPLYRSTRTYEILRNQLLKPSRMADGIARSIALERLKANHLREPVCPLAWQIVEEEIRQLHNDDIPAFFVGCADSVLRLPQGAALPLRSGLSIARRRIRDLTRSKIDQHLEQIRACCFFSHNGRPSGFARRPLTRQSPVSMPEDSVNEQLIEAATALAEQLTLRSHRSRRCGASWVGIHVLEQSGCLQLAHAGLSLYSGNAGLLLLYAACAALKLNLGVGPSVCDMVQMTVQPITDLLDQPACVVRFIEFAGLGGVSGIGSLIYSLTCSAGILQSEDLLRQAQSLAAALPIEMITASDCSDVMGGLAGLLLALLALYRQAGDGWVLELCRLCGDRLLANARPVEPGMVAWPSPSGKVLCGMSHGVAGIAMALAELSQVITDPAYCQMAMSAIAFENHCLDPASGHWLDLRGAQPAIMNSWCNGAPGIGLARLAMYRAFAVEPLLSDLDRAISLVQQDVDDSVDQLCCGLMGQGELLLTAGLWSGRQELVDQARELAIRVLDRSGKRRQFRLLQGLRPDLSMPGFFQGTAGIAYQLLRLSKPSVLPSILAFETSREWFSGSTAAALPG